MGSRSGLEGVHAYPGSSHVPVTSHLQQTVADATANDPAGSANQSSPQWNSDSKAVASHSHPPQPMADATANDAAGSSSHARFQSSVDSKPVAGSSHPCQPVAAITTNEEAALSHADFQSSHDAKPVAVPNHAGTKPSYDSEPSSIPKLVRSGSTDGASADVPIEALTPTDQSNSATQDSWSCRSTRPANLCQAHSDLYELVETALTDIYHDPEAWLDQHDDPETWLDQHENRGDSTSARTNCSVASGAVRKMGISDQLRDSCLCDSTEDISRSLSMLWPLLDLASLELYAIDLEEMTDFKVKQLSPLSHEYFLTCQSGCRQSARPMFDVTITLNHDGCVSTCA